MKTIFSKFTYLLFILNFIFTPYLYALDGVAPPDSKEPVISMDMQDASLKDVLKILSMQSNLNFIASEAIQDRKITLYMDKVPLGEAMNKIFKANNLSYELDREAKIFIVKDWGKPSVETVTEIFYLKHATVSSSSLKEEMKNNISIEAGTSSSNSLESKDRGKWKIEDESGITISIKKLLSKEGSIIEDFRTNSLIVTDIPSRMEVIRKVVASLDISIPQVMLEVEMLDVSKDVVDQLGVNWPSPLLTADFGAASRGFNPFGKFGENPQGKAITYTGTGLLKSASWMAPHFGPVLFGVLNDQVTLDFLRTQTDTRFLARPKILTLNNETAEIKITTDEAIGISSVQQGQGESAATTVTAERYETGVMLRVTPQIDITAGEITMFIYPKVSEASTTKSSFNASVGNNPVVYTFTNPEVRSTKATVRIKDGETVVLGGLIRKQNTTIIKKLPVLGDIPILGKVFTHKEVSPGKERELLVFITPRIIKDSGFMGKVATPLQQAKSISLPQTREQSTVSVVSRQSSINAYMNALDKQRSY